eukprot:GFYU01028757.1.p1 GENE.GFYU01028757.1~~GFYU01028757.1.p1  ORF type:complete len:970 (+),score=200.80 GFYU01028757.1:139-3048(+)
MTSSPAQFIDQLEKSADSISSRYNINTSGGPQSALIPGKGDQPHIGTGLSQRGVSPSNVTTSSRRHTTATKSGHSGLGHTIQPTPAITLDQYQYQRTDSPSGAVTVSISPRNATYSPKLSPGQKPVPPPKPTSYSPVNENSYIGDGVQTNRISHRRSPSQTRAGLLLQQPMTTPDVTQVEMRGPQFVPELMNTASSPHQLTDREQMLSENIDAPFQGFGPTPEVISGARGYRIPSPVGKKTPDQKAMYYLEFFKHDKSEVRMGALNSIHEITPVLEASIPDVILGLCRSLEVFQHQDESFCILAIKILEFYHMYSSSAVGVLVNILKSTFRPSLYPCVISLLLHYGIEGGEVLVDAVIDGSPATEDILSAVSNLPRVQSTILVPNLIREVQRGSAMVKEGALIALSRLSVSANPEGVVPILCDMMLSGKTDRMMVASTIRTYGMIGEQALVDCLQRHQNSRVRAACAEGLGMDCVPDVSVMRIVVDQNQLDQFGAPLQTVCLVSNPDDAAHGHDILLFDAREMVSSIKRLFQQGFQIYVPSEGPLVGTVGGTSITNVGPRQHLPESEVFKLSDEAIAALTSALLDKDDAVRASAAKSLSRVGLPRAGTALRHLVSCMQDKNMNVRAQAVESIGCFGSTVCNEVLGGLVKALRDDIWKVRYNACVAIGRMGPSAGDAVPALVKMLNGGSMKRDIVASSMILLGKAGELALMDHVRDDKRYSTQVRVSAVVGLGLIDVTSVQVDLAVECLYQASRDQMPLVRRAAVEALAKLGGKANETITYLRAKALLPFLYSFLKDKDKGVRESAAECLAACGPHGELLLIEGVLKDPAVMVRMAAAYGLHVVGPSSIRTLLLAMNDQNVNVRVQVIQTIESMGLQALFDELKTRPAAHRDSVILSIKEILNTHRGHVPKSFEAMLSLLMTRLESSMYYDPSGSVGQAQAHMQSMSLGPTSPSTPYQQQQQDPGLPSVQ